MKEANPEKTKCCIISTIWYFGKGKTMEMCNYRVARGWEWNRGWIDAVQKLFCMKLQITFVQSHELQHQEWFLI